MVFACLAVAASAATDMRAEGSRQLEEDKGVDFHFVQLECCLPVCIVKY